MLTCLGCCGNSSFELRSFESAETAFCDSDLSLFDLEISRKIGLSDFLMRLIVN